MNYFVLFFKNVENTYKILEVRKILKADDCSKNEHKFIKLLQVLPYICYNTSN